MVVRLRLARYGLKVKCGVASLLCPEALQLAAWRHLPVLTSQSSTLLTQNNPFFRIVAADKKSPQGGRHVELLGHYDPKPSKDRSRAFPRVLLSLLLCSFLSSSAGDSHTV